MVGDAAARGRAHVRQRSGGGSPRQSSGCCRAGHAGGRSGRPRHRSGEPGRSGVCHHGPVTGVRSKRVRLDQLIVDRGLAESRSRAQALLIGGRVRVGAGDEARLDRKAGDQVDPRDTLEVAAPEPYVSRGGHKLAAALDAFGVDPADRVCLDVGASTGGFTDVLLQRGARRVYAVDVGRGQLAEPLRRDSRVISMERTNARNLTPTVAPGAGLAGERRRLVHLAAPRARPDRFDVRRRRRRADPAREATVRGGPRGVRAASFATRRSTPACCARSPTPRSRPGSSRSARSRRRSSGRRAIASSCSTCAFRPSATARVEAYCHSARNAAIETAPRKIGVKRAKTGLSVARTPETERADATSAADTR